MFTSSEKFRPRPYRAPRTKNARYKPRADMPLNARQRKQIKMMIKNQGELKHLDGSTSAATQLLDSSTVTQVSAVTQGDGETQRLGDRIIQQRFRYTGQFKHGSGAAARQKYSVRIILFRWLPDTDDDTPVNADILQDSDVLSLYIADDVKRKKFHVLHDELFNFGSTDANGDIPSGLNVKNVQMNVDLKNKVMNYGPAATTGTNHIYLLKFSNTPTANAVVQEDFYRFTYRDSL